MMRNFIAATLLLLTCGSNGFAAEKLIYAVFWEGCEHGCKGFLNGIAESGFPVRVEVRDAAQDKQRLPGFVEEARALDADLVLTYGTSVTLGIAGRIDAASPGDFIHDRPLVFMYVSDPFGSGIAESFEASGRDHVAGTYNRVPEDVNFRTIRTVRPDFRHLGMIYARSEQNSVLKVAEMTALAAEMGFRITALEIDPGNMQTPDPALIDDRVAQLAAAGVDFIYLGSSSFLRLNGERFTNAAVQNGLPVLSPYEEVVRENQALLSIAARASDVGVQAARQALKILRDGATPGELPISRVTDFAYVINMGVARKLNLFPPIAFLQISEIVE